VLLGFDDAGAGDEEEFPVADRDVAYFEGMVHRFISSFGRKTCRNNGRICGV
jgi:hypothetical protein